MHVDRLAFDCGRTRLVPMPILTVSVHESMLAEFERLCESRIDRPKRATVLRELIARELERFASVQASRELRTSQAAILTARAEKMKRPGKRGQVRTTQSLLRPAVAMRWNASAPGSDAPSP